MNVLFAAVDFLTIEPDTGTPECIGTFDTYHEAQNYAEQHLGDNYCIESYEDEEITYV